MIFGEGKESHVSERQVVLLRQVADSIITYAKTWHPNEGLLILRGKKSKGRITVDGLVIPPFSSHGPYYSSFMPHELPLDGSYMGTVHSHPSRSNRPSLEDLNHFYCYVSLIIGYPYEDETIAAYDRDGNSIDVKILDDSQK